MSEEQRCMICNRTVGVTCNCEPLRGDWQAMSGQALDPADTSGICLRDFFAGFLSQGVLPFIASVGISQREEDAAWAVRIYERADALLAARTATPATDDE